MSLRLSWANLGRAYLKNKRAKGVAQLIQGISSDCVALDSTPFPLRTENQLIKT
jgi:hypothetical protein